MEYGIYQPHCGLDNVMLSWGHDEVGPMTPNFTLSAPLTQHVRSICIMS